MSSYDVAIVKFFELIARLSKANSDMDLIKDISYRTRKSIAMALMSIAILFLDDGEKEESNENDLRSYPLSL